MLVPFACFLELDITKYVFVTSSNFNYNQSNSCYFVKFTAFLRHLRIVSLEFLNMLMTKINCVLYCGLVPK